MAVSGRKVGQNIYTRGGGTGLFGQFRGYFLHIPTLDAMASFRKMIYIWYILVIPIILIGIYLFVRYVLYFMFIVFCVGAVVIFELYDSQRPLLNLILLILCALTETYLFIKYVIVPLVAVIWSSITTHKNGGV